MTSDVSRSDRKNPSDPGEAGPDQDNRDRSDPGRGDSGGGDPGRSDLDRENAGPPNPDPQSDSANCDLVGRWYGFLGAGSILLGLLIALADLASAWVIVALPLAVIVMAAYGEIIKKMLGSDEARIRCAEDERPVSEAPPN
ncbi:hypothetical protein [Protofrankia symbiont of Coriaria ruscifolia]|uniref:Putative membrane protein n=1 Tax=Candidatus Protofrankia californiensis TaxID=1839754 RepID=A0A1C3NXG3_9ACTN|nr:hypothetical protein [Protofrankia symbiont of Coriaria ruscifolia]SBW22246.1 putative membrane protein [Candidatus Protofrankia californiensis]